MKISITEKQHDKLIKAQQNEQTMSDSSGSFEAPMSSSPIKRKITTIPNSKPEAELKEVTDASSSGSYDAPFGTGGKNPLKIDGVKSIKNSRAVRDKKFPKWGGPGGKFVEIKAKCKKFPYCNQGDIKALHMYNESIEDVAKEYGIPVELINEAIGDETIYDTLKSVNNYFVDLQNRYKLTPKEERVWKKVSFCLHKLNGYTHEEMP